MMTRDELLALIAQAEREGWTELDLSGQGLRELPPEIGQLTQLEVLKLGYRDIKAGYFVFRQYNHLRELPSEITTK